MINADKKVHLDEVLLKFGGNGRYQNYTIILIGFAFFNNIMHCINYIIVAEDVDYRCKISQCETGESLMYPSWSNFSLPPNSKCYTYSSNSTDCLPSNFMPDAVEPCNDWVYSDPKSFVAEFQLACQDWKRTFVGTVHSIGLMLGLFFQGQLSDKIGRKATLILSGLSAAVCGVAKSYATTYVIYILLELLESTIGDNCSPAYIMSVELVHGEHRLQMQFYLVIMSTLGGIAFSVAAYMFPYWRHFVRVIYAPSLLFLLYFFILDESPRWLLSKGKKERAIKTLKKIGEINNVEIEESVLENIQCEDKGSQKSPLMETFRSKIVVTRFVICVVWWISCTFICFGLLVNVVSLGGNKYINIALMTVVDIPASLAMVYILKRFRRKKPLLYSFLLAGIMCVIQAFIPKDIVWLSTGLYLIGKFLSTFTFSTVYLYTSELFPTYTRNTMHALCSAIGRIGSILAPMTPLLVVYMETLPTLLIGAISLFAGVCTLLVPDLADEPLPDNVQQAELIGSCNVGVAHRRPSQYYDDDDV